MKDGQKKTKEKLLNEPAPEPPFSFHFGKVTKWYKNGNEVDPPEFDPLVDEAPETKIEVPDEEREKDEDEEGHKVKPCHVLSECFYFFFNHTSQP